MGGRRIRPAGVRGPRDGSVPVRRGGRVMERRYRGQSLGHISGIARFFASHVRAGPRRGRHDVVRRRAPTGVRVNCLAPSAIVTDKLAAAPQRSRDELAATFPLGRLGNPGDVTGAALYLLSDASAWITGATLDIAGGKVYA
jgi:hypothetical protein